MVEKEKTLEEKYDEYQFFLLGKGYYHAFQLLGEIYNSLPLLENSVQEYWLDKLHNEDISMVVIEEVEAQINDNIKAIKRIISAKDDLIFEEIVLLLTGRIQIDLILSVLREIHGDSTRVNSSEIVEVDTGILKIRKTDKNKKAFNYSIQSIKKHWQGVTNKWLDD